MFDTNNHIYQTTPQTKNCQMNSLSLSSIQTPNQALFQVQGTIEKIIHCGKNKNNYYVVFELSDDKTFKKYKIIGHTFFAPTKHDMATVEGILNVDEITSTKYGQIIISLPSKETHQLERILAILKKHKLLKRTTKRIEASILQCKEANDNLFDGFIKNGARNNIQDVYIQCIKKYVESRQENNAFSSVRQYFQSLQFTMPNNKIQAIVDKLGEDALHKIQTNLEWLIDCSLSDNEIQIIMMNKLHKELIELLKILILRRLHSINCEGKLVQNGHVCYNVAELYRDNAPIVHHTMQQCREAILNLKKRKYLVIYEHQWIYLSIAYTYEHTIAHVLKQIAGTGTSLYQKICEEEKHDEEHGEEEHEEEKKNCDIESLCIEKLNDLQRTAVKNIFNSNVSCVTGKAGSGKSMIIQQTIDILQCILPRIICLITVPTGKATTRFLPNSTFSFYSEYMNSHKAYTLHKIICYGNVEIHHEEIEQLEMVLNTRQPVVLFIDEMTMVDNKMMYDLLTLFVNHQLTLVLLGDERQLPSIGAGNVFTEIIKSQQFPVTQLVQIHRQNNTSTGLSDALEAILQKQIPQNGLGFTIMEMPHERIYQYLQTNVLSTISIPQYATEFACLTHTHQIINEGTPSLRQFLNKHYVEQYKTQLLKGDIVKQTKNNYELDVYNGMIGIVQNIYEIEIEKEDGGKSIEQKFEIYYPENQCIKTYRVENVDELQLSYMNTVHSMQGSERNTVIVIMPSNRYNFFTCQMLYTAVSRAKQNCIVFCENKYLLNECLHKNTPPRNTCLAHMLCTM